MTALASIVFLTIVLVLVLVFGAGRFVIQRVNKYLDDYYGEL